MKKLLPIVLLILLLSGCSCTKEDKEIVDGVKSSIVSKGAKLDDLGNIVNGQFFFNDGVNEYYSTFDNSGNPHIYVTNISTRVTKTIFDGFGWSLVVRDGWLYFCGNSGTTIDATYTLFRIKTDGTNLEHINDEYSMDMNFYNEWLYYVKKDNYNAKVSSVYRSSLDGTNEEEIASGVSPNGIFVILEDKLYYLDQDYYLTKSSVDGSNKEKIISEKIEFFVIGQGRVIYLDQNNNIKSCQVNGTDIKTIRESNGTDIYIINSAGDTVSYVIYSPDFNQEKNSYPYSIYTVKIDGSNDKKVYDGLSWGYYVNILNDKIYVLDYLKDTSFNKQVAITRNMNLDGSGLKDLER